MLPVLSKLQTIICSSHETRAANAKRDKDHILCAFDTPARRCLCDATVARPVFPRRTRGALLCPPLGVGPASARLTGVGSPLSSGAIGTDSADGGTRVLAEEHIIAWPANRAILVEASDEHKFEYMNRIRL